MKLRDLSQLEFSSVFFDTLFGLVLFFGLDGFLDIGTVPHFIFYIVSTIVVVHWWLLFKSADDAFSEEVTDSAVDLIFGIIDVILIDYMVLLAKTFDYHAATGYLVALLCVDLLWAVLWRYVGKWNTKSEEKILFMEHELNRTMIIDVIAIVLFALLLYFAAFFSAVAFVSLFAVLYFVYILMSFWGKVIDLRIF
jgi:hypothetical protein